MSRKAYRHYPNDMAMPDFDFDDYAAVHGVEFTPGVRSHIYFMLDGQVDKRTATMLIGYAQNLQRRGKIHKAGDGMIVVTKKNYATGGMLDSIASAVDLTAAWNEQKKRQAARARRGSATGKRKRDGEGTESGATRRSAGAAPFPYAKRKLTRNKDPKRGVGTGKRRRVA